MFLQPVSFGRVEFGINAAKLPLDLGVSGHRGEVSLPNVAVFRHGKPSAVEEALQQGELGFG